MYIDQNSHPYFGDMQPGDREATAEEVAAWNASRVQLEVDDKLAQVRAVREVAINRVNGIAAREARAGNTTILSIGDAVVVGLIAMTKNLPTDLTQIDSAILSRYVAIRAPLATTAPELVSAFEDMDK